MHTDALGHWQHDHTFDQEKPRSGERRTLLVIALTASMMVAEIAAGLMLGSMALLADGLHMASHTAALSIAAVAYIFARRHARNRSWSFGTGKVNALGGFASAVVLVLVVLIMAWESTERFFQPVAIVFDQALIVAVIGLAVNGVSAWILNPHDHAVAHHHGHGHGRQGGDAAHHHGHVNEHGDHNLRAAYLHVVADAVTSVLAIVALLAGKLYGLIWMDPLMGIVGAVLVARWAWSLLRDTGRVLLDREASGALRTAVETAIEGDGDDRIVDLHVWSIGPRIYAAIISVVTHDPKPPEHYKKRLPDDIGIVHATVEVHHCRQ